MKIKDPIKIEERKVLIITEAKKILLEEGIEGFTIRKLAKHIDQTPGIIYHYFKDKDELLFAIVSEGYRSILEGIRQSYNPKLRSDEQMAITIKNYIQGVLEIPEFYLLIMRGNQPVLKAQTEVLNYGIRKERQSIDALCKVIERGIEETIFQCTDIELRAQCIWASMYGLIDRMIVEKVEVHQQQRLIEEFMEMVNCSLRRNV